MRLTFNKSIEDYRTFLRVRQSPVYRFSGSTAIVPDEYAAKILGREVPIEASDYQPSRFLFDYQRDIAAMACRKRKFAAFVECGLGKTLILSEFAQHAESNCHGRPVLIVSPLMVIPQTLAEINRFYPGTDIEQIESKDLQSWLKNGRALGITNYEALTQELEPGRLAGLVVDESSMLKSHYGRWATRILGLAGQCEWRFACTGTPAPNDRIEYANHSVFCGAARTVNEFLARYFVNRGQTDERWEMKPWAVNSFYRDLSHWCIFLSDPAVYGWRDNADKIPPIEVHIHRVEMTQQQQRAMQTETGGLFVADVGGIGQRGKLGQIAKGSHNGERIDTNKPQFIRQLVDSWPNESTLIWCIYNDEQDQVAAQFPDAANIDGDTPLERRLTMIEDFKSGRVKVLISKPKILGFGLNLQIATRQVFSGLQDSYESYWQAVKRSNRVGSTRPLN
jgi:superfamily II DNA or RNA helicase